MDPVSLSEIVGRELFILTTSNTPIRLEGLTFNDQELHTHTSLDVIILEIPEGLGYTQGGLAQLFIAQREDKTTADITWMTSTSILHYTTSEIAPDYFGLLNQGKQGRIFQIGTMEIR